MAPDAPFAVAAERRRAMVEMQRDVRELRDYVQRDLGAKKLLVGLVSVFGVSCALLGVWMVRSTLSVESGLQALTTQTAVHEMYGHSATNATVQDLRTEIRLLRTELDNLRERMEERGLIRPQPSLPASSVLEPPGSRE